MNLWNIIRRLFSDEDRITALEGQIKHMVTKEEFNAELKKYVGSVGAYVTATNALIAAIKNPAVTDYTDLMSEVTDAEPNVATLPALPTDTTPAPVDSSTSVATTPQSADAASTLPAA